jgi:hypothetical protein
VPGNGIPYCGVFGWTVVFSRPYRLIVSEPGSDSSGKVMARLAANAASVSRES